LKIDFSTFPVLETERLVLRQLDIRDKKEIRELRSDGSVNEFLDRKWPITVEEAEAFIQKILKGFIEDNWLYWAITLKEDPRLIGTICFWNYAIELKRVEIGYELLPRFHGQGLMNECLSSVINFAFHEMKARIITALPKKGNQKSINILQKNQFIQDRDCNIVPKEEAEGFEVYYLEFKE
jgi:ribosomal-protein-alanine N-acetyltransferase